MFWKGIFLSPESIASLVDHSWSQGHRRNSDSPRLFWVAVPTGLVDVLQITWIDYQPLVCLFLVLAPPIACVASHTGNCVRRIHAGLILVALDAFARFPALGCLLLDRAVTPPFRIERFVDGRSSGRRRYKTRLDMLRAGFS
jgi:hypothetical protein